MGGRKAAPTSELNQQTGAAKKPKEPTLTSRQQEILAGGKFKAGGICPHCRKRFKSEGQDQAPRLRTYSTHRIGDYRVRYLVCETCRQRPAANNKQVVRVRH